MEFKTCLAAFLCALVLSNTESMESVDRECPRFAFEHKLLESLVRVEHAVKTLGRKFNNLEERMDRLESGHNCHKKAIAFTAVLDHRKTFTSRDILKFNSVLNNAGNGYDPESGLFTAPLSGTYMFSFQIEHWDTKQIKANLMLENVLKSTAIINPGGKSVQSTGVAVIPVLRGQSVWIQVTDGQLYGSDTCYATAFSGAFLY